VRNIRLNPGGTTRCPAGRVTVRWLLRKASQDDVALVVVDPSGEAVPSQVSSPLSVSGEGDPRGLLQLPSVSAPVDIVARPAPGRVALPTGAQFQVALEVGRGDVAEIVQLAPADIGGLAEAHLARVSPDRGALVVAALEPSGRHGSDVDSGTGSAPPPSPATMFEVGRNAARRLKLNDSGHVRVTCAIDLSASMLPFLRGGAVTSLLELLAGFIDVVGEAKDVDMWKLSTAPGPLAVQLTKATAASYVETQLSSVGLDSGARMSTLVMLLAAREPTGVVYVITDDVPGDLEALSAALEQLRTAGGRFRLHLVVYAASRLQFGGASGHVPQTSATEQLEPLARLAADGALVVTAVPPDPTGARLRRLLGDDALADALMVRLGSSIPVPAGSR
jgi:hypothetical protein